MAFFGGYLLVSSAILPFTPSFFGNEGAKVIHMPCKFHLRLTCNFQVFIFQIFLYQQKVPIQAASEWFFGYNSQKCGQIGLKFCPVMLYKVMHQILDNFYSILKKWSKLSQKSDFLAAFQRFFVYALLRLMSHAPVFFQIKCFMELHNCSISYQCNVCDYQVINFQFFCGNAASMKWPFWGGFWALSFPNIAQFC